MRVPGTWHFYGSRDFRLLEGWPGLLAQSGAVAVIEPQYALCDLTPHALALGRIWQKRWIARSWQLHGLRLFVDLSLPRPFEEMNFLGVPKGWRSYSTAPDGDDAPEVLRRGRLAQAHAGCTPILLVVLGGGPSVRRLCDREGYQNLPLSRLA
jgi:hypothetical protein